jgi:hypothetical protein
MKSKIEADDKTYEEFIEKGSNIHVVPSLWGRVPVKWLEPLEEHMKERQETDRFSESSDDKEG